MKLLGYICEADRVPSPVRGGGYIDDGGYIVVVNLEEYESLKRRQDPKLMAAAQRVADLYQNLKNTFDPASAVITKSSESVGNTVDLLKTDRSPTEAS